MKENKAWYNNLIKWREKHIGYNQFIILLSLVIGLLSAFAAFILKTAIGFIQHLLIDSFATNQVNYWYLVFPFIGVTLSYLFVRYVVKDDISHGVTKILYAISQRKSIIKLHNTWSSLIGSTLTIAFGGSVGAESPIVLTGSAIGSNLGNFFKLDQKTMMLLLGCGSAGAIAGIFKAPIAGLVFTLEVLMLDMTMASIVPLLLSSVSAASLSYFLTGSSPLFYFTSYVPFDVEQIPTLILLGIVCGFVSLYFTRGMNKLETLFRKMKSPVVKLLLGGVTLSVLIFFFPPLFGEGYNTIEALLNGNISAVLERSFFQGFENNVWMIALYLLLIIFFKVFASAATTSPGGVGGVFAPSLFVGSITGFVLAFLLNDFGINASSTNFAISGMGGLMAGVMHAPLTGIFLIAELTSGYNLFMPLMIVATTSYVTIRIFEPHSLYAIRLAQKGELITHHKDRAVLTLMRMENVIETDLFELYPDMTLRELVGIVSKSHRNVFPVVNPGDGKFVGLVTLDEIRNIMFRPELYERFTVNQLMVSAKTTLLINQPMEDVMRVFEDTGAWNLPVVDEDGKYKGFVSKSKIFNTYRHLLVHFSDE